MRSGARSTSELSPIPLVVDNANEDCEVSSGPGITHFSISGTNLDSDDTCLFGDSSTTDLLIGPLTDNGGPTATHALLDGSPAVDAASSTCIAIDQRGIARPIGRSCDVGAYEKSFTVTVSTPVVGDLEEQPTVNATTLCWGGPGALYDVVSSVTQGTQVELLGIGEDEGWFVIVNPRFGIPCWIAAADLDIDPQLDIGALQEFSTPPVPTTIPTVLAPPAAPSGLQANTTQCDGGGYKVTVIWSDEADNEEGYRVYRMGPGENNYQLITSLGPNATGYVDSPLGSGPYSYYVEAFNDAGAGQSGSDSDEGCLI